jgi:ComF family protein
MTLIHAPLHRCGDCRRRGPAFSHAWSGYPYEGPLRDAIRLWKYGKRIRLAKPLGRLLADAYVAGTDRVDMLVPVPLHPERLRDRGFNQSLLLADRLARAIEAPVSYTNLARTAAGPAQSVLTRKARLRNLRRAFTVRHPAEIAGKRVLIVDDVFTTGTTVNECAKALRRAGARDVVVATLARVV